jgi:hypothetical protein
MSFTLGYGFNFNQFTMSKKFSSVSKPFVVSVFLLFALMACITDTEIDLLPLERKPVVNCLFSPQKAFVAYLSYPQLPTDTTFTAIENAMVNISGSDGSHYNLLHRGKGLYTSDAALPKSGIRYNINIEIPGFEDVSASDLIPESSSKFLSYTAHEEKELTEVLGAGESFRIYQKINFRFQNDLTTDDWLGLTIVYGDSIYWNYNLETGEKYDSTIWKIEYIFCDLNTNDPKIVNNGFSLYDVSAVYLFNDQLMKQKLEDFYFKAYIEKSDTMWMKYYNYSPSCYEYFRSNVIHNYTKQFDFWEIYEPIPLFTNITNGYGIFAGYSTVDYILIPDQTGEFQP